MHILYFNHSRHILPYVIISYPYFFYNDTATTEIYTLSLHDALPIYAEVVLHLAAQPLVRRSYLQPLPTLQTNILGDRKSTRLNSSHMSISYAVFCLKKKKN